MAKRTAQRSKAPARPRAADHKAAVRCIIRELSWLAFNERVLDEIMGASLREEAQS